MMTLVQDQRAENLERRAIALFDIISVIWHCGKNPNVTEEMSQYERIVRTITIIAGIGLLVIILGAFGLSFVAMKDMVEKAEIWPAGMGWIIPIVVDGSIVVFSMTALYSTIKGDKCDGDFVCVIAFTAISVFANVVHAWPADWDTDILGKVTAIVLASLPPVGLFLTFHRFVELLKRQFHGAIVSHKKAEKQAAKAHRKPKKAPSKEERHEAIPELAKSGMKAKEMSEHLKTTERTIWRDLEELGIKLAEQPA